LTLPRLVQVFSMVGPIEKVIMGLNQQTRTPCGFAFVIYFSHKAAQSAASYITGTKLDNRYIRVDVDWGFQKGREFGRGKSGGQVRAPPLLSRDLPVAWFALVMLPSGLDFFPQKSSTSSPDVWDFLDRVR
jgi:RNA recognition motif-containing protein